MTLGWSFLDPAMGIAGAFLISRWSYGLMREAGGVLLDRTAEGHLVRSISRVLEAIEGVRIVDLHVWRLGPGHHSAIVSIAAAGNEKPDFFKKRLCEVKGLSHVTIEVNASDGHSR